MSQPLSVFSPMPGREYKGGTLGMSVKVLYVQHGRVYYRRANPASRSANAVFSKTLAEFQEWVTM